MNVQVLNIGGQDYNIKDLEARSKIDKLEKDFCNVDYSVQITTANDRTPYNFITGETYRITNDSDKRISFRTLNGWNRVQTETIAAGEHIDLICTENADYAQVYYEGDITVNVTVQRENTIEYTTKKQGEEIKEINEVLTGNNIDITVQGDRIPYNFTSGKKYRFVNNGPDRVSVRILSNWTNVQSESVGSGNQVDIVCNSDGNYVQVYYDGTTTVNVSVIDLNSVLNELSVHEERITEIEQKNEIPSYYESVMETKMPSILNNQASVGRHGDTFFFITDIHWEGNDKQSPSLIRKIAEESTIRKIIMGGDYISQGETEQMRAGLLDMVNKFAIPGCQLYMAFGNHDSNWNSYGGQEEHPERHWTLDNSYAYYAKIMDNEVTFMTDYDLSFYFDNSACKTRYIVIDTGEDHGAANRSFTAYDELANVLIQTPANWHVIIIAHIVTYGAFTSYVEPMLDAYNAKEIHVCAANTHEYDFTGANATVEACFGGHRHYDEVHNTESGIPVVMTSCDAWGTSQSDPYPYETNSSNNQCFDVVSIDYTAKTIKCTRIGHGIDRNIL